MSSIISLLSLEAAKKGLTLAVERTFSFLESKSHSKSKYREVSKAIATLSESMKNIRYVKTILSLEESVDLIDFYYPTKIEVKRRTTQKSKKVSSKVINELRDFDQGGILVTGTVGQGKSIFLRYLTACQSVKGICIPVFVELRKLNGLMSLKDLIINEVKSYGIVIEKNEFELLCEKGQFVLFLDGFDEIRPSERSNALWQVESLINSFKDLTVVMSSRPNTGAENSSSFKVYRLSELEDNEYIKVIDNFLRDDQQKEKLIRALQESAIATLLRTPLMVALTVVRFKIEESIPTSRINFFSDLFDLLIRRHDHWKSGFKRDRDSKLSDWQLRKSFDAICYIWKKEKLGGEFSREQFQTIASAALNVLGLNESPDSVIKDICEITCLVIEDGGDFKFAHKSIQEFHSASFLKDQPDSSLELFFRSITNDWKEWKEELRYMETIDAYRFSKYFVLPESRKILDSVNPSLESPNEKTHSDPKSPQKLGSYLGDGNNYIIYSIIYPKHIRSYKSSASGFAEAEITFSLKTMNLISEYETPLIRRNVAAKKSSDAFEILSSPAVVRYIAENELNVLVFDEVYRIHEKSVNILKKVDNQKGLFVF